VHPDVERIARKTFILAQRHRYAAVVKELEAWPHLLDELGDVLIGWIDIGINSGTLPPVGEPAVLHFSDEDTGQVIGIDQVHPATAWAARLINARLADDEAGFDALWQAAPDMWHELCEYVISLVALCCHADWAGRTPEGR